MPHPCYPQDVADARNKPPLRKRLAALYRTYGRIALVIYMVMWILTVAVFGAAIYVGFKASSATGLLGTIGAAWLAAKMTTPLRILATIAITRPIAGWWRRRHPVPPMASEPHRRIVEAAFAASGRNADSAPPEDPSTPARATPPTR